MAGGLANEYSDVGIPFYLQIRKRIEKAVTGFLDHGFLTQMDEEVMLSTGQQPELNEVFSTVYEELKRIAASIRRKQYGAALNTTTLVHEAWIKLRRSPSFQFTSDAHFKAIAATAMRQILFDAARRNEARKRGGAGAVILVELDEAVGIKASRNEEVIALEMTLRKLAEMNMRQARVVECRFYGSMTVEETAEALGISESVVERDWRAAKAWLSSMIDPR
jgi:RNA polymerase sigma factor (TIGR02999 family)